MTGTEWALHLAIGVPLGLLYGNASEWLVHRYFLHGLGKTKGSFWSFHWHDHHKASRLPPMRDAHYLAPLFGSWDGHQREAAALTVSAVLHSPIAYWFPGFYLGALASSVTYYFVHRQSHLDFEWAKRWLPWHVDHHLGPDQDANWCVTFPLSDWIMGTRVPYLGTERERQDNERLAARAARAAARDDDAPSDQGPGDEGQPAQPAEAEPALA